MNPAEQCSRREAKKMVPFKSSGTRSVRARAQLTPRKVFCVTEHAYRNHALAEAVCAGRFTHAGITVDFSDKPDWPDWLATDLPADEEWRIEWSKFYYGLDLAYAWCESGDDKFLRAWERLVRSWIRQVQVGSDPSDVTGRRIQNWVYAWNAFASAPGFRGLSKGLDREIAASIDLQVQHLRTHLTAERNHRTLELYALLIVALAFPEIGKNDYLLDFAVQQLHHNLLTDIRPDGVHRENSTHYHMVVLRSFLAARENARRFGLAFPNGYDARLERACEFALHCHRPDGTIPMLSDSDTGSYSELFELAASLFGRPDFLYAATAGALGSAPKQRNVSFLDGGYYIQRSGWGEGLNSFKQERFLIFDCGPLGDGGHGHYDLLNIEIAAGGRPLVVDPGRFTYSEGPPNWRRWFKGTSAHNTVCVDGTDQTPYSCGKPKGPVARGRLIDRLSAPGLDVLCGEVRSPSYEAVHTRRIFFVADEYWIIADRLRGERSHRFDLRFHLSPESWGRTELTLQDDNSAVRAPGVALVFDSSLTPSVEQGWVAPQYGIKLPAPVVSVVADEVVEADFFTLIAPFDSNIPTFRVRRTEDCQSFMVEVSGVGLHGSATDQVAWNALGEPLEIGPFKCRAASAWLRVSTDRPLTFQACDVQELTWASGEPTDVFPNTHQTRWVSWDETHGFTQAMGRGL